MCASLLDAHADWSPSEGVGVMRTAATEGRGIISSLPLREAGQQGQQAPSGGVSGHLIRGPAGLPEGSLRGPGCPLRLPAARPGAPPGPGCQVPPREAFGGLASDRVCPVLCLVESGNPGRPDQGRADHHARGAARRDTGVCAPGGASPRRAAAVGIWRPGGRRNEPVGSPAVPGASRGRAHLPGTDAPWSCSAGRRAITCPEGAGGSRRDRPRGLGRGPFVTR